LKVRCTMPRDLVRKGKTPFQEWQEAVEVELARRHDLMVDWVPAGVMTKLYILGTEPIEAAAKAKTAYNNNQVRKWLRW